MKATTLGYVLLTCQSLILYGLLWMCQAEYRSPTEHRAGTSKSLSEYPLLDDAVGNRGFGTIFPDNPIVVRSPDGANELYRLRADGTEWYAPGVDRLLVQQKLFLAQCLQEMRCL